MVPLFETIVDPVRDADRLRRRRYGVIEVTGGELQRIRLRPYPKIVTAVGPMLFGRLTHGRTQGDWCRLYYNQPLRCSNFLAVTYVVSSRDCSLRTFRRAVSQLDSIAKLKGTDALLCDVANSRISDRLLERWGWQPHCPQAWHRNFIKRFYGIYPETA